MILSPSFLSCDFNKLESEIKSISEAEWLHFDVMDGNFVSNKTYDYHMLKLLKQISDQFFDCHLMIERPEKVYEKYILSGAAPVTFPYEATKNPLSLIKAIKKDNKTKAGISIKPDTDVTVLKDLLADVDLVLIMSVEPGAGGQKFLKNAIDKIKYLDEKRKESNLDFLIEVDGGINLDTAKLVKEAGCDVIVVGSYIFKNDHRNKLIGELQNV